MQSAPLQSLDEFAILKHIVRMKKIDQKPDPADVAEARKWRQEAAHLQDIEGNPLDAEQIEMFEMFEREGWPHEERRAYMAGRSKT